MLLIGTVVLKNIFSQAVLKPLILSMDPSHASFG